MHELIDQAVPPIVAVVRAIRPDQLDAPTPCPEWTVRQLGDHLLEWGPALVAAGQKSEVAPAGIDDLETYFEQLARAWSDPDAWAGVTRLGGPMEMPATMIGGMVLGEVVVHGWDLARATGQTPEWPADLLTFVYDELAKTAEQGREMGLYGPPVPVPDTAPTLDRILGLTGRDPAGSPGNGRP